ncbi:DUF6314 family protein [Pacificoceanicola onchidii]|uniref:DUF6314 family protein n=1 Tax=Pacificoceanicola onchidii TaxID=2562685 RepID=UPI0010A538EF|nr:DUF6314 family protein [Pacificoceanicola onchidii]
MTQGLTIRDFAGLWTYERFIDDRTGLGEGHGKGEAIFTEVAGEMRYDESGTLSFAATPEMKNTRRYLWRPAARGADVFFDDGRPFHSVDLGQGKPQAAHWCDPDQYDVTYDFSRWPEWSSTWVVKGPRKDYKMTTTYRRS